MSRHQGRYVDSFSITPSFGMQHGGQRSSTHGEHPHSQNYQHRQQQDPYRGSNEYDTYTKLIIVSHGETINEVFPQWLRLAYKAGEEYYQAYDLNMPVTIPKRPAEHYRYDPPLTEHGNFTAEFIGKGIKLAGYDPYMIYSSPELRCVQTAAGISRAAGDVPICIEPALADWAQLVPEDSSKNWLSFDKLKSFGYPIVEGYRPHLSSLPKRESPEDYLRRLSSFVKDLSKSTNRMAVLVTNSHAIEVARNNTWTTAEQICQIKKMIRNCATCEVGVDSNNRVTALQPMMLPFTKTLKEAQEKTMAK
ncbi:hypothetical protein RB195_010638 [Necator americanus]|uniref:Phosphoglycerate mutase family protein n=1 Tax=Necator americanus TaxID=51031 RepID=A0ABR1D068_NECAM